MLIELDDETLAVSVAANTRMGWAVERTPLTIDPVEADWDEEVVVKPRKSGARMAIDSDDESSDDDVPTPPGNASKLAPFEVAVIERGSDAFDQYVDEPGTLTVYGCRLCTALVPSAAETVAWTHLLRVHGKACMPTDDAIFAVRCPLMNNE